METKKVKKPKPKTEHAIRYGDFGAMAERKLSSAHDYLKNRIAKQLKPSELPYLWDLLECEREVTLLENN